VTPAPDRWSQWLLERRHGGDERQREATLAHLGGIRDRVLAGAEPLEGATLLDVGAGDGLIGLTALDRVGPNGSVVFADVSPALLDECRRAVAAKDAGARARFIRGRDRSEADHERVGGRRDDPVGPDLRPG
jgi:arsenite methyltransferase